MTSSMSATVPSSSRSPQPSVYGVPRQMRESSLALKPAFVTYYKEVLGEEGFARYVAEMDYYLPKAVRMNPLKMDLITPPIQLKNDVILYKVWQKKRSFAVHRSVRSAHFQNSIQLINVSKTSNYIRVPRKFRLKRLSFPWFCV